MISFVGTKPWTEQAPMVAFCWRWQIILFKIDYLRKSQQRSVNTFLRRPERCFFKKYYMILSFSGINKIFRGTIIGPTAVTNEQILFYQNDST